MVIVGGGFAGLAAARRLERDAGPERVTVALLSDANYMTYTPFVPQAAAGTLEPRHVVVPLRQALRRTHVRVGHVLGADVAVRLYPSLQETPPRWVLIEATDAIFPEVGTRLAAYAMRELTTQGVELRLGTTVTEAARDGITLSTGEHLPCATLAWTAGVRPAPLVRRLRLPVDPRGRIRVNATMAVEDHPGVWALGVAAAVPDPARPGLACPATSQHAVRQGRLAARNILACIQGRRPEPFRYRTIGRFVDLGRGKAVASVLGIQFKGFTAWFLGRTYHLSQVPGVRRKGRIAADWAIGLLFRRDVAELGVLGHPEALGR